MASFQLALDLGCDLVEMDVRRLASGELVLYHDDEVAEAGVRRLVQSMTLGELQAALGDAGPQITRLEPALDLLRDRAVPLLDLKGVGFERQLGEAVRAARIDRSIVCGNPLTSLLATQATNLTIATSLTFDAAALARLESADVATIPTDAVTVDYRRLTSSLVDLMREAGLTVIAWTVDGSEEMRRLLGWGVDGITTNRPDTLAEVLRGERRH